MLRDSAGAAMVALMYADMPGVSKNERQWARCMAKQTVDFIIGQNPDSFSYVVGVGCGVACGYLQPLCCCDFPVVIQGVACACMTPPVATWSTCATAGGTAV